MSPLATGVVIRVGPLIWGSSCMCGSKLLVTLLCLRPGNPVSHLCGTSTVLVLGIEQQPQPRLCLSGTPAPPVQWLWFVGQ